MLLTTTTFVCTEATGPKFWLAWSQGADLQSQQYSYITPGYQVSTGQTYLEVYDTEEELAGRVDAIKGVAGWYWECENRIPYPPNPNEWECPEPDSEPEPEPANE